MRCGGKLRRSHVLLSFSFYFFNSSNTRVVFLFYFKLKITQLFAQISSVTYHLGFDLVKISDLKDEQKLGGLIILFLRGQNCNFLKYRGEKCI